MVNLLQNNRPYKQSYNLLTSAEVSQMQAERRKVGSFPRATTSSLEPWGYGFRCSKKLNPDTHFSAS